MLLAQALCQLHQAIGTDIRHIGQHPARHRGAMYLQDVSNVPRDREEVDNELNLSVLF